MSAEASGPDSVASLLRRFRACFSVRGFEVFTAMFTGFVLRPVQRTVCGMLTGAGLAGVWHHSRAHRFFADTRWNAAQVGLSLARLVLQVLTEPDTPGPAGRRRDPDPASRTEGVRRLLVARRVGRRRQEGRLRQQLGGAGHRGQPAVLHPPRRPADPVLACEKGGRSNPDLARDLLDQVAEASPSRTIHLVGDAAYGAGHFAGLGANITMTTRARSNAVFHHPTPPATGRRGRPRLRGPHRHPDRHRPHRHRTQHLGRHRDPLVRRDRDRPHHRGHRSVVRGMAHRPGPGHPGRPIPPP